ncbi:STAR protein, partial [Polypterus senegalus]
MGTNQTQAQHRNSAQTITGCGLSNPEWWTCKTNGDTVSSKVIPEVGKVFKLEAVLDATPRQLYYELFEKLEEISTWNPNVSKIQIVQKIDQNTMVTHEVTSLTPGNLIGQRDFVSIRHCWRQDSVFCLAGAAIQIESLPPQNGFVRAEDGPSCIIVKPLGTDKSHFTWLLNMDLKPSDNKTKRRRKMLTIQEKVKLLDMIKDGNTLQKPPHAYEKTVPATAYQDVLQPHTQTPPAYS